MEREKKLLLEVFENGVPIEETIPFQGTINQSIIDYLAGRKQPNGSIVALYNSREAALDILKSEDDFTLMTGLSRFIKEYPSDIADTSLYGITKTSYSRTMLTIIDIEYRILKSITRKKDELGLIKKDC